CSAGLTERSGCVRPSSTAAEVGTEASCIPVSGGGFGPGSVETGSTAGAAGAEEAAGAKMDSGRLASADATLVAGAAVVTTAGSGGVGVCSAIEGGEFSIWGAVKVPSPAAPQAASATVPPTAKPAKPLRVMIPALPFEGPLRPACYHRSAGTAVPRGPHSVRNMHAISV